MKVSLGARWKKDSCTRKWRVQDRHEKRGIHRAKTGEGKRLVRAKKPKRHGKEKIDCKNVRKR